MQKDSKVNPSTTTKNISIAEIDTRFDFQPDYLAKSSNFIQEEGSKGQKPQFSKKFLGQ